MIISFARTSGGGGMTSGEVQTMIDASISGKQDTLIEGENITISANVISADSVIIVKFEDIDDAKALEIAANPLKYVIVRKLSNKDDIFMCYSEDDDNVYFRTDQKVESGALSDPEGLYDAVYELTIAKATGDISTRVIRIDKIALKYDYAQHKLTAGENITISGNVISAAGGGAYLPLSGGTLTGQLDIPGGALIVGGINVTDSGKKIKVIRNVDGDKVEGQIVVQNAKEAGFKHIFNNVEDAYFLLNGQGLKVRYSGTDGAPITSGSDEWVLTEGNVKTINGESIYGEGDIDVVTEDYLTTNYYDKDDIDDMIGDVETLLAQI